MKKQRRNIFEFDKLLRLEFNMYILRIYTLLITYTKFSEKMDFKFGMNASSGGVHILWGKHRIVFERLGKGRIKYAIYKLIKYLKK